MSRTWPRDRAFTDHAAAMHAKGRRLRDVPQSERSYAICLLSVRRHGWDIADVPEEHLTEELCVAAARQNGAILERLAAEKRTRRVCAAAVEQNGSAIAHVPAEHMDEALAQHAVIQNAHAMLLIPEAWCTPWIYHRAVSKRPELLQHVPFQCRTLNLCETALKNADDELLRHILNDDVPQQFVDTLKAKYLPPRTPRGAFAP